MNPSPTCLVVDDEESLVKLVSHLLEMQGYNVLSSPHSEAALKMANIGFDRSPGDTLIERT